MHPTDKKIAIAFGVWGLICLALFALVVFVVVHFVAKAW